MFYYKKGIKYDTSVKMQNDINSNLGNIYSLKKEDVLTIAEIKFIDMGLDELGAATKAVEGTARSMGINVID